MSVTFLNRTRGGGGRALDADVLAWRDAVAANGGSVSLARLIVVDQFVFSEKASGNWLLTDEYLGLWAENVAQALTSLKQRRLATAINSPIFTQDRDFTFDGSASYIDTGFVPDTHALSMTTNNIHMEVWERTTLGASSSSTAIGVSSGSNRILRINSQNSTNFIGNANGTAALYTLPVVSSIGLTQQGRSGTLAAGSYGAKNGVALTRTQDPSGLGTSLPSHSIYIGAQNSLGAYGGGRAASVGYVSWGAALSGAQCLARYNAVQAWATSVGAQI